ncbi:molecular chaperone Tir [Candidatus Azambacteria bacterium RIFCSPHIGHO2_02_FULL_52_12]|uniref:Molecular chaperone Tir n=1 Tax=Candidatus Azambacteria bacterium RIFCSPLOWO2_01_FULL_46_25 TaxID=1797298 RepID=A0A1F5BTZ9_9BACT|nr:MAG: molecular chaperone Tir [Candidatus Azambacteria bacterium RIFCSPHIGHO2_02_FULL_52_12]OGD34089.1 MAG: molecular chaperone Tir [Candidatus Azambacteria bacterium RIFCSPLOWO2_01_FULL_46_25]OGD36688.1 MAG: molecular chaperone Tir [Candidatus Azambacteria bacterium RIFCSPHIGHO2_01_FULL_51_74]
MKQYSIFISHSWAYEDNYERLVKMLKNDPRFNFKDYSVPKDDPIHNAPNSIALTAAIQNQMRFCDVIIMLAGVYSTYSIWINKEINIAKGFTIPKPILAIEPFASERTSQVVKDNADKIVKWNTGSIVSGIRELA